MISSEVVREQWDYALEDKQKDIAISWNVQQHSFMWLSVKDVKQQMKMWRKMAKKGELKICGYNNRDVEYDGKTWYILVAQPYKDGDLENCNIDPMSMCIFSFMVSGYCYAFRTKENRDMTYNYVMKDIAEPSKP